MQGPLTFIKTKFFVLQKSGRLEAAMLAISWLSSVLNYKSKSFHETDNEVEQQNLCIPTPQEVEVTKCR
jgi:hypothetical protein